MPAKTITMAQASVNCPIPRKFLVSEAMANRKQSTNCRNQNDSSYCQMHKVAKSQHIASLL